MASYTGLELSGTGTPTEALTAGVTYTFTFTTPSTLEGSAFFTFETVRDANGFYVGASENAVGTLNALVGTQTPLQSPFIFSTILQQGGGSFAFTPTNSVSAGGAFLRATGNISLTIS
jgi:hypothetical protein